MKCELCGLNEVSIEVKQVLNDDFQELHICSECAALKGIKSPIDLAGMLLGGGLLGDGMLAFGDAPDGHPDAGRRAEETLSCPVCHMRAKDFRSASRLGCGHCYETFGTLLQPMILSMQRATEYKGKQPAQKDVRDALGSLTVQLERAIREEAYEDAARLRDQIRVLQLADACLAGGGTRQEELQAP